MSNLRSPTTAVAWATKDAIHVEFPTKEGTPYVVHYPKTIEGLMEALGILELLPSGISPPKQADHPAVKRKPTQQTTVESRSAVRGVLQKMGLI